MTHYIECLRRGSLLPGFRELWLEHFLLSPTTRALSALEGARVPVNNRGENLLSLFINLAK
jgi:hypothetical protein